MKMFLKLVCPCCSGKYHVDLKNAKVELPLDIELGEAFPFMCPLCNISEFSVVVNPREEKTNRRNRLKRWL